MSPSRWLRGFGAGLKDGANTASLPSALKVEVGRQNAEGGCARLDRSPGRDLYRSPVSK
jgi:hypothetical protein